MKTNRMTWMLGWAAVQGISLLLLHNGLESLAQPGHHYYLIWPLYIIAAVLPLTLQMLAQYRHQKLLWLMTALMIAILAAFAAYLGYFSWVEGLPEHYFTGQFFLFGLIITVSWYLLLPFAEHRLHYGNWFNDYGFLFWAACGNNVRLMSAALFTGLFWAVLGLWAGLFKVLKIDFFADLFTDRIFAYPASAMVFSIGLSLYASKKESLLNHYRTTLNLVAWLLPLVASIMLLFLAVLPFKGLEPLWQTGHATALMLGLSGLMIALFNAAWQDATVTPKFSLWLLRLIKAGFLSMPVYIALSAYALGLRINQHGWSIDRVWAGLLVLIMAIFAIGYALAALRHSPVWMSNARFVNISGALTLVLLLLMTGTPILDPARIAVDSQVSRLLASQIAVTDFDFQYLRFDGGRRGDRALKSLLQLEHHPHDADIRKRADATLKSEWRTYRPPEPVIQIREELIKKFIVYPKGTEVELSFFDYLLKQQRQPDASTPVNPDINCLRNQQHCYLISIDMNADRHNELIIFDDYGSKHAMFTLNNQRWQYIGYLRPEPYYESQANLSKILETGDMGTFDHAWRGLRIGKRRYSVDVEK